MATERDLKRQRKMDFLDCVFQASLAFVITLAFSSVGVNLVLIFFGLENTMMAGVIMGTISTLTGVYWWKLEREKQVELKGS